LDLEGDILAKSHPPHPDRPTARELLRTAVEAYAENGRIATPILRGNVADAQTR
jgi:hypothetical protein